MYINSKKEFSLPFLSRLLLSWHPHSQSLSPLALERGNVVDQASPLKIGARAKKNREIEVGCFLAVWTLLSFGGVNVIYISGVNYRKVVYNPSG